MTPRELPHAAQDLQMLEQTWADPRGGTSMRRSTFWPWIEPVTWKV